MFVSFLLKTYRPMNFRKVGRNIMKRFTFALALLLCVPQIFASSPIAGEKIAQRLDKEIVPIIEKDMARLNIPGLSAAVVLDGQIIWKKGIGYADREKKIKATPDTVYRIASISKLFNAVAIMQLLEKGKLDINADIKKYLPYMHFENPFDKPAVITVRHLLCHRADILRESPVGNYFDDNEPALEETVKSMIGTSFVYPPGTRTKYSNIGVGIAGHILEKTAGQDFAEYQKQFVLKPLCMNTSSFLAEDFIKGKLAKGYMRNLDGRQWEAPHFRFGYLPAANLYSNVIDLAKFANFIFNEGRPLLKKQTLKEMTTVQFTEEQDASGFGLGFSVSKTYGIKTVRHGGALYGFSSTFKVIPEKKLAAIVLVNLDCAGGFKKKIADFALGVALEEMTGKKILNIPTFIESSTAELKRYEGKYERNGSPVWLALRKGVLCYEPYGPRKELSQISKAEFLTNGYEGYGEKVTMVEEKGKVIGIKINGDFYKRAEEINIKTKWAKLTGEYGPDFNVMKVYEKDGKLTVLIEWFYEYPLEHLEGLCFAFGDYGLYHGEELLFKQSEGKIIGAMVGRVSFKKR